MRMRDLEKASGVGRETIRFYIREGLLPEPKRVSRNSAFYNDEHVLRLKAIKRLQEERFLPLAVIRGLLEAEDSARWLAPDAFPLLDKMLAARIGARGASQKLGDIMEAQGFDRHYADAHVATGMVEVDKDGRVSPADAAILDTLKALWDLGFTRDRGFMPADMRMFVELVEWLVTQEMKMFFGQMVDVAEDEAADMATAGVALINVLLGQLHNRAVLKALQARHLVANDNGDDESGGDEVGGDA